MIFAVDPMGRTLVPPIFKTSYTDIPFDLEPPNLARYWGREAYENSAVVANAAYAVQFI